MEDFLNAHSLPQLKSHRRAPDNATVRGRADTPKIGRFCLSHRLQAFLFLFDSAVQFSSISSISQRNARHSEHAAMQHVRGQSAPPPRQKLGGVCPPPRQKRCQHVLCHNVVKSSDKFPIPRAHVFLRRDLVPQAVGGPSMKNRSCHSCAQFARTYNPV